MTTRARAAGPWLRVLSLLAVAAVALSLVSGVDGLGTGHRLLAALGGPPLVALAVTSALERLRGAVPAAAALVLFGACALATQATAHLVLAGLALAAAGWAAAACHRGPASATGTVRDYLTLTKPRVMTLLLLTGFCGMVAGARGLPGASVAVAAMVGLALACGGASALNHVLDEDIDRLMGSRTNRRPVAAGRVRAGHALEFGLTLSALSFALLASAVNLLAATLALAGGAFYVVVYTRLLKRATVQNIVIGGAAGAVPPLVGWAAGNGRLGSTALLLFAIVFLWTPPHFWALALLLKRHYQEAGVPMLPVVRGEAATARQILAYSVALVAATCVPYALGTYGPAYLAAAVVLGVPLVALAWRLRAGVTPRRAATLFHYSLGYLALLFAAIAAAAAAGL